MKFIKANFKFDGMYLNYIPGFALGVDQLARQYFHDGKVQDAFFVARFKHRGSDRSGFTAFLIKNFTVEEYLEARAAGIAPMTILESKGYVTAFIKGVLKEAGYPQTQAGKQAFIRDQITKREKDVVNS